jgi:hypothetical protein
MRGAQILRKNAGLLSPIFAASRFPLYIAPLHVPINGKLFICDFFTFKKKIMIENARAQSVRIDGRMDSNNPAGEGRLWKCLLMWNNPRFLS